MPRPVTMCPRTSHGPSALRCATRKAPRPAMDATPTSPAASAAPVASVPPAELVLRVNNIEVVYNRVILVLKGISFEVPRGGIVALLGANGAGKTTTLKAISNLLQTERGEVTKGTIVFDGVESQ